VLFTANEEYEEKVQGTMEAFGISVELFVALAIEICFRA
jgi:hypothetical protein